MSVTEIRAEVFTKLPDALHISGQPSDWVDANKPGGDVPSFLEGPSFDRDGNLWCVDIPWGRIFRITPAGEWSVGAEYDGWPNGLRVLPDGTIQIADYKRGIVMLDPKTGETRDRFSSNRSEGFKGCNDLFFGADGTLYFTDQGTTGLHDPTGRVYRVRPGTETLERLISNGPSPNGLVTSLEDKVLYVAMTRAAAVWRVPLFPEGPSKVGLFARLPAGVIGPDGMALDENGTLYVCHASRGRIYAFDEHGEEVLTVDCRHIGRTTTNLAFGGENNSELFITVSDAGVIARAKMPVPGRPMYSHTG
ncbi:MAG: SMP-30/gluconolactonase/LRE family protein [Rhodospirillales bacterium]|jgi:gluconolactonase|nr:SMP-30/gluconolactonase/LRE family protein [Rhodospirillales bacterium]